MEKRKKRLELMQLDQVLYQGRWRVIFILIYHTGHELDDLNVIVQLHKKTNHDVIVN